MEKQRYTSLYFTSVFIGLILLVAYNFVISNEFGSNFNFARGVPRLIDAIKPNDLFPIKYGNFNINEDLLVLFHIQKTSGSSFEKNIAYNLLRNVNNSWINVCECQKGSYQNCICNRDNKNESISSWFIARPVVWWPCRVHPFLYYLEKCIKQKYQYDNDESKVKYFTFFRDPVERYISEWNHVRKNGNWNNVTEEKSYECIQKRLKRCVKSEEWENITFSDFLACQDNLASNRQTKMLANYDSEFPICNLLNKSSEMEQELLKRAKNNLNKLSFFGITEYQKESQILFEHFMGPKYFKFENYSISEKSAHATSILPSEVEMVKRLNLLDIDLYNYVVEIFIKRLSYFNIKIASNITNGEISKKSNKRAKPKDDDDTSDDSEQENVNANISEQIIEQKEEPFKKLKSKLEILDILFHPTENLISLGLINGKLKIYNLSKEKKRLVSVHKLHKKSIRKLAYPENDSHLIFTASKDKSIKLTNMKEESNVLTLDDAHESPINCLVTIDNWLIGSADDEGCVKIWDYRRKTACMESKTDCSDYISDLAVSKDKKILLATCGEGTLSAFHTKKKKMVLQSELMDSEMLCVTFIKNGKKAICGSGEGVINIFNYDQWGNISDRFPGHPSSIDCLLPLSDDVVLTGCFDGNIRACHILPNRFLGVIGNHENFPIQSLALSNDGNTCASISHDDCVKFWNIEKIKTLKVDAQSKSKSKNLKNKKLNITGKSDNFFSDLIESKESSDDDDDNNESDDSEDDSDNENEDDSSSDDSD